VEVDRIFIEEHWYALPVEGDRSRHSNATVRLPAYECPTGASSGQRNWNSETLTAYEESIESIIQHVTVQVWFRDGRVARYVWSSPEYRFRSEYGAR